MKRQSRRAKRQLTRIWRTVAEQDSPVVDAVEESGEQASTEGQQESSVFNGPDLFDEISEDANINTQGSAAQPTSPADGLQAESSPVQSSPIESSPVEGATVTNTEQAQENTETRGQRIDAPMVQEQSDPVGETPASNELQQQIPDSPLLDSPIQSVLQQRNMLRSRKKKQESESKKSDDAKSRQPTVAEMQQKAVQDVPDLAEVEHTPYTPEVIDPSVIRKANQVDKWANMVDAMALNGRLRQMAINATIDPASNDETLILCLNQKTKHLKSEAAHQQLVEFVSHYFNRPMEVELRVVEETVDDPFQIQSHINDKRYDYAKDVLYQDEIVQQLQEQFQAELDESTVVAR